MAAKSSTSGVLIALVLIITFPIWIGIAGGIFGIVAGLFGVVFGIIGAVFGAIFGVIGGLFGWIFNWHWPFGGFFHWNFLSIIFLIAVVLLVTRSRKA